LRPVDLIFLDADKPVIRTFSWALKLSRRGASSSSTISCARDVINAARTDLSVQGFRRLKQMLATEKRR